MPAILAKLNTEMGTAYPTGSTWRVILIADTRTVRTFTVDTGTDVLTTATNHDYLAGTRVQFSTTGTLPTSTPQIVAATDYLVAASPGSNTLSVTTVSGTAINFTNTGSGTHTITDVQPGEKVSSIAEWVRKEVASYDGIGGRPTWASASPTTDLTAGTVTISDSINVDNSSGTTGVSFNMGLLIEGGSATRGNTTGTASDYYDFTTTRLIGAGDTATIVLPVVRQNA